MPKLYISDETGQRLVDHTGVPVLIKLIPDDEIAAVEDFIRRTTADPEDFERGGIDNFGREVFWSEDNLPPAGY